MRVEQQVPVQLQNAVPARNNPIPAGIGQSHSSILQNNTCCDSIGKALHSVLEYLKNLFKRFCNCFQKKEALATPGVTTIGGALELKNSMLDRLCNRDYIRDQEIDFIGAPNFKAAVVFKLGDQIIASHFAEVNMDALENAFYAEASIKLERAFQERAVDGIIRGESLSVNLMLVKARADGNVDGKSLDATRGIGIGLWENGEDSWPATPPGLLLMHVDNNVPGAPNEALKWQLIGFFLNRQIVDGQPVLAQLMQLPEIN